MATEADHGESQERHGQPKRGEAVGIVTEHLTYHGKRKALSQLVPQLAKMAIDTARPRTRLGKISEVSTQMTPQMERASQAM